MGKGVLFKTLGVLFKTSEGPGEGGGDFSALCGYIGEWLHW